MKKRKKLTKVRSTIKKIDVYFRNRKEMVRWIRKTVVDTRKLKKLK